MDSSDDEGTFSGAVVEAPSKSNDDESDSITTTFAELGIVDPLCQACEKLGWKHPTAIQRNALPEALAGRDLIGLAETGNSSKFLSLMEHYSKFDSFILLKK